MESRAPTPLMERASEAIVLIAISCAVLVTVDLLRCPQKMWIMNLVWPLTLLYSGPLGLLAYASLGRAPPKEARTKRRGGGNRPFWAQVLLGATHCGAGCTVGDVVADWSLFAAGATLAGSELGAKFAGAFVLAYLFGVVFQYFTIAPMRGLGPAAGLWAALKADTLSLIAFEVGMFAWMALTQTLLFPHLQPTRWTYWFMMQIAMLLGLATTYPVNWWLIRKKLKEPM